MNRSLRRAWSISWRIGLAVLLMAWAFHAIFHDQCRVVLAADRVELDALPRLERWGLVWSLGPRLLAATLVKVQPAWLAASIILWGVTIVLGAWRWHLVLRAQGLEIGLRRTLEISLIAHFFNSFLLGSTGGDLLKAYYAARVTHHLKTEAVTAVFLDRILGLFGMLAFAVVMIAPNHALILRHGETQALALAILGMFMLAGLVLLLSLRGGVSQVFPGFRARLRRIPKVEVLERGLEACRVLGRNRGLMIRTLALSGILTIACILQLQTLVWGYGGSSPLVPLAFVVPAVICISALPITPNGLGVRDNLYLYLLSLPEIGIVPNTAVAISLVAFAGSLVWSALGGLLYILHRRESDLADAVAEERDAGR